ncbi:MAG: hypothetical protein AB1568_14075 [Thermodesulfobacteriota bacterium]
MERNRGEGFLAKGGGFRLFMLMVWLIALQAGATAGATFLHAPHSPENGLACRNCHEYPFDSWPGYVADSNNPDDTIRNFICLRCHASAGGAPAKGMHSSLALASSYPGWTTQCVDCHDPHFQQQLHYLNSDTDRLFLATGRITGVVNSGATTTIGFSGLVVNAPEWSDPATWSAKSGSGRGLIFVDDVTAPGRTGEILSATPNSLVISGTVDAGANGRTFGLLYGMLVRNKVRTPAGSLAEVKFFEPNGGFTSGAPATGICQVCHVQTTYWRRNNVVANDHNGGSRCTSCHLAVDGFKPSFPDHLAGGYVVRVQPCITCHDATDVVGVTHKGQCGHCHTQVPALVAGLSRGDCLHCHGPAAHDTTLDHNHRIATASCATCHDVGSQAAIDVVHRSDCATCHGYGGGRLNLDPTAVANAIETGKGPDGTDISCLTCHVAGHDTTVDHDHRIAAASCASCHAVAGQPAIDLVHRSDCSTCHGYTGGRLNLDPAVVAGAITAGKGPNGTDIDCQTCHVAGHDTTLDHNHRIAAASCATCHDIGSQAAIDVVHRSDCSTCHGYTGGRLNLNPTLVAGAINTGRGVDGSDISCQTCHSTPHNTTVDHNHRVATASCATCHSVASQVAIDVVHRSDCSTCHGYTGGRLNLNPTTVANAIATGKGADGIDIGCQTCHVAGHDTTVDHNHRIATASCATCHAIGSQAAIDVVHRSDCSTCHGYTGGRLNLNPTAVANAIAAGKGTTGVDITCQTCHATPHNTTTDHDKRLPSTSCAGCHPVSSQTAIDTLHRSGCGTCHGSTKTSVTAAITSGRAGSQIYCEACHTGDTATGAKSHGTTPATAAAVHDQFVGTPGCSTCHPNGSIEQRLALHKSCTVCHASTSQTVLNAIASGRAGSPVRCITCHTGNLGVTHHANPNVANGNCTWCHADPRSDWTTMQPGDNGGSNPYPTQLACAKCHVRVSGTTIYVDKITYGSSGYASPPTKTVQHVISGVTGGAIYNYGMCFSCHNGVTATRVSLYHAKPASAASRNRYDGMRYAPGRGSFNLFWSTWHGREDSSFGRESYKGNDRNFQNPAISYKMIAVPCGSYNGCSGSATKTMPVLPAKPVPTPAGTAVHDMFSPAADCGGCHAATSEMDRTVGLHGTCALCHTSTKASVVTTILAGINTTGVNCKGCHDGTSGGAASHGTTPAEAAVVHDRLSATTSCGSCHAIGNGSFTNVYTLHRSNCTTCHGSANATVQAAITAGRNGTAINCTSCHGTSHHSSPQAVAGNCTHCHVDPRSTWTAMRPGDNGGSSQFPTQLGCKQCHVRVVGSTIYIDKIRYGSNGYGSAPIKSVQHTLSGVTGGKINNFGICFSCHNGIKATRVGLYHAKPASAASRNRCSSMRYAPGRGSFNLFWSTWHGQEESSFGSESCKNDSDRYRNPAVSYRMMAIPCGTYNSCSGSSTKTMPVLPALP